MTGDIATDRAIRAALTPDEHVLWHSQPGAMSLFLDTVPRIVRDVICLVLVIAGAILNWNQRADPVALTTYRQTSNSMLAMTIGLAVLAAILACVLIGSIRRALSAKISHYVITETRLIFILPRDYRVPYVFRRRGGAENADRTRPILVDAVTRGEMRGTRATVRFSAVGDFRIQLRYTSVIRYRTMPFKMIAVTDPDAAVALLGKYARQR